MCIQRTTIGDFAPLLRLFSSNQRCDKISLSPYPRFSSSSPLTEAAPLSPPLPRFIFSTGCGVMCLDIHPEHPHLLAAGLYDGTVAVYNLILTERAQPVFRSTADTGKHTDPVWQVLRYYFIIHCHHTCSHHSFLSLEHVNYQCEANNPCQFWVCLLCVYVHLLCVP